ncbi:glycoside hydrolase family 2 [Olivibacter sp. SDN3]|uniref:glycosyl hydrolase n=1 Tax=Olivibacter sp. SDN3 TaxID=2764720 RepID=UPI0016513E53|nr:glycosyl hydrolase [Olivibacter sp. SDN3]QNL48206.1 glycoside hydrolase family 2 [Olivibacter sp. SDN3]
MNINRRRFIKVSSLTAVGLPLLPMGSLLAVPAKGGDSSPVLNEEFYRAFKDPANSYRPFVRWWWNGNRLDAQEIIRELDVMKAAGIGGVEINPIRFPGDTDDLGIATLDWLSDEWIEMLKVALKGAKERGIVCDMIVGSGWPFGGEFLSRNDQSQMIALETRNLQGGKTYKLSAQELLDVVDPEFHSKHEDKLKELVMVKLVPMQLSDLNSCLDLTEQIGGDSISVDVPDGEYVLYYLVKLTGFMAVINGAPGAGGPVLNHYSKTAVERYLNRMSDKLKEHIGPLGDYFRSFFTDSLELEGANWCEDMFEQFKQRKGYDLAGYFPFVLFKVGEMGNASKEAYGADVSDDLRELFNRVRYDFEDVRVALFKERFIDTFTAWCKENHVQSRMQAYGRECNPLEGSLSIDIPECETWLGSGEGKEFSDEDYRRGRAYSMSNKFVSSAAHLSGKQIISCEEMTNTSMVFNASLELIKIAGDQSILSGVTHSVLHGFNYSPAEAPFPGWIRYGTYFNERNTWWPYFKLWADYKARTYALLQHGQMQADIAVLPPLADLSMKFGFQRDPFPSFAYPKYVFQIWEAIHQNGNGCDYVTENIIEQASIENGRLVYGTRSYHTLLLIHVEAILPNTANKIKAFTAAGGKLICIEKTPSSSPTYQQLSGTNEAIDILKDTDSKLAGTVPAPEKDFVKWYKNIQQQFSISPYVEMDNASPFVSQVYYKVGNLDVFFFSNYSFREEHLLHAKFNLSDKNAWLWDPETGKRYLYPTEATANELVIKLGPSESKMIVFDEAIRGEMFNARQFDETAAVTIDTPWKVELQGINGKTDSFQLDKLVDFGKREDLQTFGGAILYENTFLSAQHNRRKYLHLGEVYGVVEVEVNGEKVGLQWYGESVFDITDMVKDRENTLRIRCVTTLGNHLKSLKENKVAQQWTHYQPFFPMGVVGPVRHV